MQSTLLSYVLSLGLIVSVSSVQSSNPRPLYVLKPSSSMSIPFHSPDFKTALGIAFRIAFFNFSSGFDLNNDMAPSYKMTSQDWPTDNTIGNLGVEKFEPPANQPILLNAYLMEGDDGTYNLINTVMMDDINLVLDTKPSLNQSQSVTAKISFRMRLIMAVDLRLTTLYGRPASQCVLNCSSFQFKKVEIHSFGMQLSSEKLKIHLRSGVHRPPPYFTEREEIGWMPPGYFQRVGLTAFYMKFMYTMLKQTSAAFPVLFSTYINEKHKDICVF